jgi:3-mercaptopropionate dioxygenase
LLTLDNLLQDLCEALGSCTSDRTAAYTTGEILRHYSLKDVQLPERLCQEADGCYARHLVCKKDNGYCVVAMVWGPGQGTAVHDHGGVWCVEGCIEGQLEVTSYRMLEKVDEQRVRLEEESRVQVGKGSVGCLIPPFEHHRLHNPFDKKAITLHVYGEELCNCTRYLPEDAGDVYRREKSALAYTSVPATTAGS